jgi:hypothetical protein
VEGPRTTVGALLHFWESCSRFGLGSMLAATCLHCRGAVLAALRVASGSVFPAARFAAVLCRGTAGLGVFAGAERCIMVLATTHGSFSVGVFGSAAGHLVRGFFIATQGDCIVMAGRRGFICRDRIMTARTGGICTGLGGVRRSRSGLWCRSGRWRLLSGEWKQSS